jgi:hypothetical protein
MRLEYVPIGKLRKNPFNPRRTFDPEGPDELRIENMADSIRKDGLLQPLIVRPQDGAFEVAAGERRRMAAELAKIHEVPVLVRELDDDAMRRYAVVENLHRLNLKDRELEDALGKIWEGPPYNGEEGKAHQLERDLGLPSVRRYIQAYKSRRKKGGTRVPDLSTADTATLATLADEEPEAAQELAEARASGELDKEEFEEAVSVTKAAPKRKKHQIAKKVRRAAQKKKKVQDKAKRHVAQVLKEIEEETEEKVPRKQLKILLAADQKLLNRAINFRSQAEKLDMTYLELFQVPEIRDQTVENLRVARDILERTVGQARQNQGRWKKEWDERRNELKG